MNHSLIHKFLGLTLLVGVILAFVMPSHAADGTADTRTQSFTIPKEPAPTP